MNAARAADRLPCLLRRDDEADGWGRLERLSPAGARLETLSPLARGEEVTLSFELWGERFADARARIVYAAADSDGYTQADLDFLEPLVRRRVATALADLLSRAL